MKTSLFLFLFVITTNLIYSQAPGQFKYQAVLRDAGGNIIASQDKTVLIDIFEGGTSGTIVFTESHDVTTTAQGIINLNIGSKNTAGIASINWSSGTYYIRITVGGIEMGTSQLLSVPYALYAQTSGSGPKGDKGDPGTNGVDGLDGLPGKDGTNGISIIWLGSLMSAPASPVLNNGYYNTVDKKSYIWDGSVWQIIAQDGIIPIIHYVGELFGGGIVYFVDKTGKHGLIASLDDLDGGNGVAWSNVVSPASGAQNFYDGALNTMAIVNQPGHTNSAANLCKNYTSGGFSDWYLPSTIELRHMDEALLSIYNVLANDGDANTNPLHPEFMSPTYGKYWSSTEYANDGAWYYDFSYGKSEYFFRPSTYRVRAIRSF